MLGNSETKDIPILAIIAMFRGADLHTSVEAGFNECLPKRTWEELRTRFKALAVKNA